jgi:hypothetical protein
MKSLPVTGQLTGRSTSSKLKVLLSSKFLSLRKTGSHSISSKITICTVPMHFSSGPGPRKKKFKYKMAAVSKAVFQ